MKKLFLFLMISFNVVSVPFFHAFYHEHPEFKGELIENIEKMPGSCQKYIRTHQGLAYEQILHALYIKAFKLERKEEHKEAEELSNCILLLMHKDNGWKIDHHLGNFKH